MAFVGLATLVACGGTGDEGASGGGSALAVPSGSTPTTPSASASASAAPAAPSASSAPANTPITLDNWQTHPAIVAIRTQVDAVDAAQLTVAKREMCKDQPVGEFEREKSSDASGKIRKLVIQVGGEDGAAVTTYYYDPNQKLMFVLHVENDVHGNSSEDRVYLDPTGKHVWEVFREASDPVNNDPDVTKAPFEAAPAPLDIRSDISDPGAVFDGPENCGN